MEAEETALDQGGTFALEPVDNEFEFSLNIVAHAAHVQLAGMIG